MVYLTQLVYLKPDKETTFDGFEDLAIPLMPSTADSCCYD